MATVLLAGQPVGLIVLPLMLFHQIQLMVCATLARRYASADQSGRGELPVRPAARPQTARADVTPMARMQLECQKSR